MRGLHVVWLAVAASVAVWSDVAPVREGAPLVEGRAPPSSPGAREDALRRAAREKGCVLFGERARTSTSEDCTGCHRIGGAAGRARDCHPVDVDYAEASRARSALRPLDEVIRRGVFLPDQRLRCVTCHDERSPWAHALALPPGAAPALAVDPADPRTVGAEPPASPPQPGERVSAKPLCLACHRLD